MQKELFLRSVQSFIANAFSIGIIRNMVPKGALARIQAFLKRIDLAAISKQDPSKFPQLLDELTNGLCQEMPKDAGHWGVARKCLNLFFRDALYNVYLSKEYGLAKLEKYMEIPLDSFVGRKLWQLDERQDRSMHLPRGRTVKGLTPEVSAKFQAVAAEIAKREGTDRVHLDVVYWRGETQTSS